MSSFLCDNCGAESHHFYRVCFTLKGERYSECSECSNRATPSLSPDVYFDKSKGAFQTDPNLCDRRTGPIPFSSKREKAQIMKRLGVREAGDKEHGSRNWDKKAQVPKDFK